MVYPALLPLVPLMRTPRLPVVDWTDPPHQFKWTCPFRWKTKSGFCVCAITFQTCSNNLEPTSVTCLCQLHLSIFKHKKKNLQLMNLSGIGIWYVMCLLHSVHFPCSMNLLTVLSGYETEVVSFAWTKWWLKNYSSHCFHHIHVVSSFVTACWTLVLCYWNGQNDLQIVKLVLA